jgi:hypothetical protein
LVTRIPLFVAERLAAGFAFCLEVVVGTYMSGYLEIDYGDHTPPFSDPVRIHSLTEGSFSFGKDYDVFDALGDGRNGAMRLEDRDPECVPLISPKGMPSPCSLEVGWDYFYLVADQSDLPNPGFWPQTRCVPPAVAESWLREKGSHEAEFFQWYNCPAEGRRWRVISDPVNYNASWLKLDEFDAALAHHNLNLADIPIEYRVIRTAFSQLVEKYGSDRVRFVIWFS